MLEVIPSIDLLNGKVVRLLRGRYDAVTTYSDDPAAVARSFGTIARRLHLVDLEGAREGRAVQTDAVRQLVRVFGAGVQIGGGVRSLEAAASYFDLGVDRVVMGTAAVADPALVRAVATRYPGRVVLAVDARAGRVATSGWLTQTEQRAIDVVRRYAALPLAAVLYTDIERDGTETGPNVEETATLAADCGLPVIASGGVGRLDHLVALARRSLDATGLVGAIIGRSLHEQRFTLEQAVAAVEGALDTRAPSERQLAPS